MDGTNSLDLTGSLYGIVNSIIPADGGSLADVTGSSVIDRTIETLASLPGLILFLSYGSGADAGSTMGM